ncbi:MAG: hypothetical protein OXJ64_05135 [Boseongicola sp.]|nr:hypothetical protein [Boseongicola sp.]
MAIVPAYLLSVSTQTIVDGEVTSDSVKLEIVDAGVGYLDAVKLLSVASSTVHLGEYCILSAPGKDDTISSIELGPGTYVIALTKDPNLRIDADAASFIRIKGIRDWKKRLNSCRDLGQNPTVKSVLIDLVVAPDGAADVPIVQMEVNNLKRGVGLARIEFHNPRRGPDYSTIQKGRIVNGLEQSTELSKRDKLQSDEIDDGVLKALRIKPAGIETVFSGSFKSLKVGKTNLKELVPPLRERISAWWFVGAFILCFGSVLWIARQLGMLQ